jgi:hypothetical protein
MENVWKNKKVLQNFVPHMKVRVVTPMNLEFGVLENVETLLFVKNI